ncbi:MAG: GNAT family N-acetyltransferase [Colwellia sp.]|nr:GNAT family N-acetyltransferase [Colwellia sp.]
MENADQSVGKTNMTLRALRPEDRQDWGRLWAGYLRFYETELDQEIYDLTFSRLLSDKPGTPSALILASDDQGSDSPVQYAGLVHYLYHAHCWHRRPICYLQDLFVSAEYRQHGFGRRLIEGVYEAADKADASGVYWMTQSFNHEARQLYDRIGTETPFIKYQRA